VRTAGDLRCGIYLQGATEHAHGISAGLLSNTAVRAGEIVRSIVGHEAAPLPGPAAQADWNDLDDPAYLFEAAPARRQA
jgi:L-ornithine N5-oxygenase